MNTLYLGDCHCVLQEYIAVKAAQQAVEKSKRQISLEME